MTKAPRMLLMASAAVLMTGLLTIGPAFAQDRSNCVSRADSVAALIKAPAVTVDAKEMRKAARLHQVGTKLCAAGERFGAAKKFAEVEQMLGVQTASTPATVAN